MNPFQHQEPSNSFYETVQVGRYGNFPHDVTIFYTLYGIGSGGKWRLFAYILARKVCPKFHCLNLFSEFSANGGQILDDQSDRGNRKLTVYTNNGNIFEITRQRRGGSSVLTVSFVEVKNEQTWVNKMQHSYVTGYTLNTAGYWMNDRGRTYF